MARTEQCQVWGGCSVTTEWIKWIVLGLTALAQILVVWRSEKAHKAEIAARDAQLRILSELTYREGRREASNRCQIRAVVVKKSTNYLE